MNRIRGPLLVCCASLLLAGCEPQQAAVVDLGKPQHAYAQLLSQRLPVHLDSLQGYTRSGPGYHSYLRFKLDAMELRKLLGEHWQTQACSELEQRLSLPDEAQAQFQPRWQPRFDMTTRCFESEQHNHWGRADHILVIEADGLAHFHGVAN